MNIQEYQSIVNITDRFLENCKADNETEIIFNQNLDQTAIFSLFTFLSKIYQQTKKIYHMYLSPTFIIGISLKAQDYKKNECHSDVICIYFYKKNHLLFRFNKFYKHELDYELAFWVKHMLIECYFLSERDKLNTKEN